MCTLIALHRCVPGAALVVAANRDEFLARPASGPAWRDLSTGPVVAPRDETAGGTWLGVNVHGLFAAITNRPTSAPDPQRRSRGLLVLDALARRNAREAAAFAAALSARSYNPFNLFVADERDAFAVVYDEKPRGARLSPGVHVIGNADPNDRAVPKVGRLLQRGEALAGEEPEHVLASLGRVCRQHETSSDPLESVCIHGERYGTRSSTLLLLGSAEARLWHAEGSPCRNEYQDFTPLLERLRSAAPPHTGESLARGAR